MMNTLIKTFLRVKQLPFTQLEQSKELNAAKSPLLFVKQTRRATTKAKKKKEIEDAKLLHCR